MVENLNSQKSLLAFFQTKTKTSSESESKVKPKEKSFEKIPGFQLVENFITEAEESFVWKEIYKRPWNTQFKRRIQYYGLKHHDDEREKLICLGELPEFSTFIVERIMEQKFLPVEPGQLCINEYRPGEGLIPHIDKTQDYGDEVIGISLGSDIIMDLISPKGEKIPIFLPRRSLYVLQGESRYIWKHGIPGRKTDKLEDGKILFRRTRASLTYRIVTKNNQIQIPKLFLLQNLEKSSDLNSGSGSNPGSENIKKDANSL